MNINYIFRLPIIFYIMKCSQFLFANLQIYCIILIPSNTYNMFKNIFVNMKFDKCKTCISF